MAVNSPFSEAPSYRPAATRKHGAVELPEHFGAVADEYAAATRAVAVFDRSDRALLAVTGADRKRWLHALVTNAVLPLEAGTGAYTFATNAKGRVLFDMNMLARPDALWLDLDVLAVPTAAQHFDRHLFNEDARVTDLTGQVARLGCVGPGTALLGDQLGGGGMRRGRALNHQPVGSGGLLMAHDFAGQGGFELIVPRGDAPTWWERIVAAGAVPAGFAVLDALRLEAGLPWFGRDMDDHVLPPETGQAERGISYTKGCFLGHEIIERMRSRGVLARRLVRLELNEGGGLLLPGLLQRDQREIGRVTSLVRHPVRPVWVGLGYLQTAVTGYADITVGDPPRPVTICST